MRYYTAYDGLNREASIDTYLGRGPLTAECFTVQRQVQGNKAYKKADMRHASCRWLYPRPDSSSQGDGSC